MELPIKIQAEPQKQEKKKIQILKYDTLNDAEDMLNQEDDSQRQSIQEMRVGINLPENHNRSLATQTLKPQSSLNILQAMGSDDTDQHHQTINLPPVGNVQLKEKD